MNIIKNTLFGIIVLFTLAMTARAGTYNDGPVQSTWYLEGTTVHYKTEAFTDNHYLYASLDPAGRDNSSWFLLVDTQSGHMLEGGFEAIYHEGYSAGYWSYSGTIDIGDSDPSDIDVYTGASFMVGPFSINCATTIGYLD